MTPTIIRRIVNPELDELFLVRYMQTLVERKEKEAAGWKKVWQRLVRRKEEGK